MEKSETIGKLAEALAKAQGEIKPAAFDAVNPHFKSKYATLSAIMEACKEPLSKNGIAIIQGTTADEGRVSVETMLIHTSGEWIRGQLSMKAERDTAQGYGAVITYGRRYSLASMVGIVADEDTDGETQKKEQRNQPIMQKRPEPPRQGYGNTPTDKIPAEPKAIAPTPTQKAQMLVDKIEADRKLPPEFEPSDLPVEPIGEIKAADRPAPKSEVVQKSAAEVAAELKLIRKLAADNGEAKTSDDIQSLVKKILGYPKSSSMMSDAERTQVIEALRCM